jgi:hypothetical protein
MALLDFILHLSRDQVHSIKFFMGIITRVTFWSENKKSEMTAQAAEAVQPDHIWPVNLG